MTQIIDREELIEQIEDLRDKLNDCLNTLNEGKDLDQMQEALINMHNVL